MPTLHDLLCETTNDNLAYRLKLLGENRLAIPAAHLATFRKVVRSLGLGVS
ncbi:MAG: hypothetical protein ACI8XO_002391 [Verrucomicrobiales bacterium]|jgi:hypothetical protein